MRFVRMLVGVAPLALAMTLVSGHASAVGKDKASGNGKGIVGGALLGGELVCSVEAIAGVQSPWAYVGGAVGGAAAGGVGGYFVERAADNGNPRVSLLMLAGGMTLLIPSIVGVLSATAYRPPADYLTDKPSADEPIANPPQPDAPPPAASPAAAPPVVPEPAPAGPPAVAPPVAPPGASPPPAPPTPPPATAPTTRMPTKQRVARRERRLPPLTLMPPALVALTPGALALSVPAVEIQDTYTRTELAMYGVTQATEVHIPVLNVVF
jgi:hypothetical protein